jgi:imidazoleglycerol-phosphate dehydratase
MRIAEIARTTNETDFAVKLFIDGSGKGKIDTSIGFFDHMMTLFKSHGKFDLNISCKGDVWVDYHHSCEDIGIALGEAFVKSLGDKRGIKRYSHIILPMDEALIMCAVDISGRAHLSYDVETPSEKIGNFDCELVREFFEGFVRASNITLHIKKLAGANSHHIVEGVFKAFARVMSEACEIDERANGEIPSTKGVL